MSHPSNSGCGEGGCGACTVVVSQWDPTTQQIYHASVNACLAPLVSVDGKHVITIEGIGNVKRPHPAQERIAKGNGSQCGFCTPGIVMSLYALLRNNPEPSAHDIEEAFDGNLCRCTGYRPILNAAQTFSVDKGCAKATANGGSGCCMEKNGAGGGCCKSGGGSGDAQPIKRFTPPGFIEYKPDTELIFPPSLKKHEFRPLAFGNKRKRWFRPVTVEQLLEIKAAYPSAKIIGGSTETQIEIRFKALQYPVSVYVGDIAELRHFYMRADRVDIGGNITLTDLERLSLDAVARYGASRGQAFAAMHKQLKYFAGRQIRNVGTPAGNLVTASPISDLNPVFLAAGATIVAHTLDKGRWDIPIHDFFTGYRRTALPPEAVLATIKVPVTREKGEWFRAYKQAKRKDDDIAIVTSAMRLRLDDDGVVEDVCLAYGGMAPLTVAAKKANAFLVGRKFAELETLEGAMNALEQDFDLPFSVPGGMASYRKALALGFFYRFYHDVMNDLKEHEDKATHVDEQVVEELERVAISSGVEDGDAAAEYAQRVVGQTTPHVAALKHATGEAQYTDDIPAYSNELHACLVLSTRAHAKIVMVDYTEALKVPGVVDFIDRNDMPSPEMNRWGAPHLDEVFFAEDEVFCVGQPISCIIATSALRAAEAARKVKVQYEDLPAIFTMEDAIEKESFFDFYREIKKGDTQTGFAESDYVFTGTARMGGQEHFYLETQAALCVPKPEDSEMEIFSSTQNPNEV